MGIYRNTPNDKSGGLAYRICTLEGKARPLTEMGVNPGIVVTLVFALFLSRAAPKPATAK